MPVSVNVTRLRELLTPYQPGTLGLPHLSNLLRDYGDLLFWKLGAFRSCSSNFCTHDRLRELTDLRCLVVYSNGSVHERHGLPSPKQSPLMR